MLKTIIFLLFLSSCTTNVKHKTNHFTLPESIGGGSFLIGSSYTGAYKFTPTTDLSYTPIENSPSVNKSTALNSEIKYGLFEFTDFSFSSGHDQPLFGNIKWQFFGEPQNKASAGNFSIAFNLGFGLFVQGGELAQSEVKGSNPKRRTWVIDSGTWHYELLTGYRLSDNLLLYGGYYLEEHSYKLEFTDGINDVLIFNGYIKGFHFGAAVFFLPIITKVNFSKATKKIPSSNIEKSISTLGLNLSFLF